MVKQHLFSITLLVLPLACAKPDDDVVEPLDEGPSPDDEVSELPPIDPEDPPEPLPSGACVYKEDPPYEGIRHQCGGSIDISLTGAALGFPVDEDVFVDFGTQVEGDSYEHPRVAACCGEYDYDQLYSEQTAYSRNCLYDAIQQFCAALPYYVWDMAEAAKDNDQLVVADQLTKLGNDLATGDKQYECIDKLWAGGPTDYHNVIFDHSWNAAYDVWVNIDVLEVYEIFLPEDPADWLTCTSIYENDDTVVPDMGSDGPIWDTLGFDAGSLKLSGVDLDVKLSPDSSSELVVGYDSNGAVLGAVQLHGGATDIAGVSVERWRIGTLRAVSMRELEDGSFLVPAGTVTFVGAVVLDGETISTAASNATSLVLRPKTTGWTLDPFSLVYTRVTGDAWNLDTSELRFNPR